jgi:hypothetical protein
MTTKTKTQLKLSEQEHSLIQLLRDWTRLPLKHHLDVRYNGDDERWTIDLAFMGEDTGLVTTGGSFDEAWAKLPLTE